MADNYLQFCIIVSFNSRDELTWFEKTMAQLAVAVIVQQWKNKKSPLAKSRETQALLNRFIDEGWDFIDMQFEITKQSPTSRHGSVTIYAEECGNPSQVAAVLEAYLKRFHLKGVLTFSWAYTCSKMRTDNFGGGAAVVTAEGSKFIDAQDWASDLATKLTATTQGPAR